MSRQEPKFQYRDEFAAFLPENGVPKAWANYLAWMSGSARRLGRSIGPSDLSNDDDVERLLGELHEFDDHTEESPFLKTPKMESNLRSTFRKYKQMVQSNFRGLFADIPAAPTPLANDARPDELPDRVRREVYRIVRDTGVTRKIKKLYQYHCQICGIRLQLEPGEFYAEAHHLKPLGQPHNGPDIEENVVCVCPNCHALLDYNAVKLDTNKFTYNKHGISEEFIDYHNHQYHVRIRQSHLQQ